MLIQLIILQIITFLAIVFVLRKLLYTETAKEVKRLRKLKEENFLKQKELQQKIESTEKVYQERMEQAEEDIRKLRIKIDSEIEQEKQKVLNKAKDEAEHILKTAFNSKEKLREEVRLEMHDKAPLLAAKIFRDILSPKVREIVHKELVGEVLEQVQKMDKHRFNVKLNKGEIVSAYPLGKSEKEEIISLVSEKLGYKILFDEVEEKQLVAGVIVRLGTLVIDGSLEYQLKQVSEGLVG